MEKIIIDENLIEQNKTIKNICNICSAVNKELLGFKKNTGYSISLEEAKRICVLTPKCVCN